MPIPGVKVLLDPSALLLYSIDQGEVPSALRDRMVRLPEMVAQPTTIEEIRTVLAHSREHGLPIVPRGSASSGFGAVLPARGGIILDLTGFRQILSIDPAAQLVRVQGGARWSDVQAAAAAHGLVLRTYPTHVFSTVAGWIATGGYGIGSLLHGHLSESVAGLRVVLPSGEERRLAPEDAEFAHFFGSDGQFGVIAEVELRLREEPRFRRPLLFAFDDLPQAINFLRAALAQGIRPCYGNLWNAARMREKNHLLHRNDFAVRPSLLLVVESPEDERKLTALAPGPPEALWKAMLCWEDRFYPIRAKKLGPGLLAAELTFPLTAVAPYVAAAEEFGRRRGYEIVVEAQIVAPDRAVVIASFLYDGRDAGEAFTAGAIAMRLAVLGLNSEGFPYNLGLWYSPFAETKFGDRYTALRRFKAEVDPQGLFNPGKSMMRSWWYTAFLKSFRAAPYLPGWFRKKKEDAGEVRDTGWRNAWDVCSKCAACVAHCPAVLAVGDERVSARGKMFMLAHLDAIGPAEAQLVFKCMHCKFCTEVCQSEIPLEAAFFDLERVVQERFGRPEAQVRDFLDRVARHGLMEQVPMSTTAPRWVSGRLIYDDTKGALTRTP